MRGLSCAGRRSMPPARERAVPEAVAGLTTLVRGAVLRFARLYRPEHTVSVTAQSMPELYISCLSHGFDNPRAAAAAAVKQSATIRDRLRTVKFCNFDAGRKVMLDFEQIPWMPN